MNVDTARSEAARRGGRRLLAAALADSRARTLALLDAYAAALGEALTIPCSPQLNPPRWEAGHIGWFQDYWIARNRQRAMGIACDPDHQRPAGRLAQADALYNSRKVAHETRWQLDLPDLAATRAYLAEGLAETLTLLAATPETDADLYFFRLVLFRPLRAARREPGDKPTHGASALPQRLHPRAQRPAQRLSQLRVLASEIAPRVQARAANTANQPRASHQ
jgi:hypothetical protein